MRQKKPQGQRGAVTRLTRKTVAGMKIGAKARLVRPRLDDDGDWEVDDYIPRGGVIHISEQKTRAPTFTGILSQDAQPIFRFWMQKPGIGFMVEGMEDYEPDAYMYGVNPDYTANEEEADDDGEYEYFEEEE